MTPIPVLRVEPGVKFDCIAPAGARIIAAVDGATKVLGFDLWISSGTEGHSPTSPHTRGEAYDVSVKDMTIPVILKAKQSGLARQYGHTVQEALPITTLTENIVRIAVMTVGFLIILNGLGLSITPILTALGVGGLAVALALQDTLANLFAGFYVTLARQIRVGDYVRLETGEEG